MIALEERVAEHYGVADLVASIKGALAAAGVDPGRAKPADLKGVDEFHTGGLEATEDLLAQLDVSRGMRVLDIGAGLGGTARHMAARFGVDVVGVDLTPAYVDAAADLSAMVGMSDRTEFRVGSALKLPVADARFDLATMFHVGMNIEDKRGLMAEAARALVPGGKFALFDVMRGQGEGELAFPFPWAEAAEFSFVDPPSVYRQAAEAAGLRRVDERERGDFALAFFARVFAAMEAHGGPPPVGIHLLMRDTGPQKIQNYVAAVKAGLIAPVEMIFEK